MADTASTYDTATTTERAARPALQLVRDETEVLVDRVEDNEARIWRSAAIRCVIGFVALTVAITIAGIGAVSSLGLWVFVGMWGGAGFGFMLGASTALARQHAADHD